jgi:hypothetical protein
VILSSGSKSNQTLLSHSCTKRLSVFYGNVSSFLVRHVANKTIAVAMLLTPLSDKCDLVTVLSFMFCNSSTSDPVACSSAGKIAARIGEQ